MQHLFLINAFRTIFGRLIEIFVGGFSDTRPTLRISIAIIPLVITSACTTGLHAASATSPARVLKHAATDGQIVQALLFQLPEDSNGTVAHDHVVFVDTSASQIGSHRTLSFAVLESLLQTLPQTDRIRLFAIDVESESLMSEFDGPQSQSTQHALDALKSRIPLGATNLQRIVETALKAKTSDRFCSIVYIGDGMSSADLLEDRETVQMISQLKAEQIPFHSFGVGPQINLQVLGVFAHHTGGYVEFDHRISAGETSEGQSQIAADRGQRLGHAVQRPVLFVSQATLNSQNAIPLPLLPLRTDRETIHVVNGSLPADATFNVKGRTDDESLQWALAAPVEQPNLAFLSLIAKQVESDQGLSNGLAGRVMMQACQRWFNQEVALGNEPLLGQKAHDYQDALQSPAQAPGVIQVRPVAQIEQPVDPTPPQPALDLRTSPDPNANLIREQEQNIRVLTEKIRHRVNDAVGNARTSDPESGLVLLKQARNAVTAANDIAPEDRNQMLKRLDAEITQLKNVKDKIDQDRVHLAERLAQFESQKRLTEQFELDEEKLEGLIDRVRALMLEGKHGRDEAYGEAQNVADVAINLRPGEGTSTAARFDSEAAQQLTRAYRLRARRADQFLETLHQVELSHIPFPDEPPVRFPPADVWKALSERRRQWADVDLHRDSPREKRIRNELKQTTEVNFTDIPLKDALDYLEELHHIEIWPDLKTLSEEGISTDTTVTLVMSGITLRSVLRLLLEPLLLTYMVEDEVLKITTQTAADEKLSTRVYPVADLAVPITSPMQGGRGGMMGGGMGGGMGGMGGGMGGMGGGMGGMGGGMGGGFFNVPPEKLHLKPDNQSLKPLIFRSHK